MNDPIIENYEVYRINYENYSLLYYPSLNIINIDYWDDKEEDQVETTIWSKDDGFLLDISLTIEKQTIEKALEIFKQYGEKNGNN